MGNLQDLCGQINLAFLNQVASHDWLCYCITPNKMHTGYSLRDAPLDSCI